MSPRDVGRRTLWVMMALVACGVQAVAQMPDARQMSGIAMPSADVPPGTVVVRVVRGSVSDNVANQLVELHVADQVTEARTDGTGRATFAGLATGVSMHAVTTIDGERIETRPIVLDATGGVRVLLAAGAGVSSVSRPAGTEPVMATPAKDGELVIGGQSRIQIEFDDERVEVYYLLEFVNQGTRPIDADLQMVLPPEAQAPAILEGSSTGARILDDKVLVSGPFAPGVTLVQVAFGLSGGGATYTVRQVFPKPWDQVQVVMAQVGNIQLVSPQLTSTTAMAGEGHSLVLGTGPALEAGKEITVQLTGFPTRSRAGRWLTLAIGVAILLVGAWTARQRRKATPADGRVAALRLRRERLLDDIARLDARPDAAGSAGSRASRRAELKTQLERVYAELDRDGEPAGML